jgi:hypothetical protein
MPKFEYSTYLESNKAAKITKQYNRILSEEYNGDRNNLKRGNSALVTPSVSFTADGAGIEHSLQPQLSLSIYRSRLLSNPSDIQK